MRCVGMLVVLLLGPRMGMECGDVKGVSGASQRCVNGPCGGFRWAFCTDRGVICTFWMLEEGAFGGGLGEMYRLGGWFVHFERVRVVKDLLGFVGR